MVDTLGKADSGGAEPPASNTKTEAPVSDNLPPVTDPAAPPPTVEFQVDIGIIKFLKH